MMTQIIQPTGNGETICDPACGSGRTLLSALKHMREIQKVEPVLYGNDLSITCAKMTLINFLLNSADGMVTCGNALTDRNDEYTFFKIDRLKNLYTGVIVSTYWQYTMETIDGVEEQRKQWWQDIAKMGWVRHTTSQKTNEDDTETTESEPSEDDTLPKDAPKDKNIQLSLF